MCKLICIEKMYILTWLNNLSILQIVFCYLDIEQIVYAVDNLSRGCSLCNLYGAFCIAVDLKLS